MPETLLSDSDLGIGAGESKDNFLTDADLGIQSAPRPTFPMRVPAQTEQFWQPAPRPPAEDQMWQAPVLPPMQPIGVAQPAPVDNLTRGPLGEVPASTLARARLSFAPLAGQALAAPEAAEPFVKLPALPEKAGKAFLKFTPLGQALKLGLGDETASATIDEIWNQAKSIPEFFTSIQGMAAGLAGAVAPEVTGAAFGGITAKQFVDQLADTITDWKDMSGPERARSIIRTAGAGGLFGLITHGMIRQPRAAQAVPPVIPEPVAADIQATRPAIKLVPEAPGAPPEIVVGEKGETHPDIIKAEGLKAEDIDKREFFGPTGEKSREQVAAQIAPVQATEFEPGKGHSVELSKAQEKAEAQAEKTPVDIAKIESVPATENGGRIAIILPDGTAVVGGKIHADTWNKAITAGVATDAQLSNGYAGFVKPDGTAWGVNGKPLPKVSKVFIVGSEIPKAPALARQRPPTPEPPKPPAPTPSDVPPGQPLLPPAERGETGQQAGGAALAGEIPETGAGGEKYGVAERVREERANAGQVATVEPGRGISAPDSIERGRELLRGGADAEASMAQFEKTKKFSSDDMALARAHGEALAAGARTIEEQFGTDSPQYREAWRVLSDWDKRSKVMQTEWHKSGMAQQGETDIDTSTFTGLQRQHQRNTGKDFTPEQKPKAEKVAKAVKQAVDDLTLARTKLFDAVETGPRMSVAEQRALDAASEAVRMNAIRVSDLESKARQTAATLQTELENIQNAAAKKGVDISTEQGRREAMRLASAENKARVAKAKEANDAAQVQVKSAQRALDAANKANTAAVRAAAEAERKNLADPSKRVWAKAKEYLDKGETDFAVVRNKVAADLKMTPDEVYRLIGKTPRIRSLADDLFIKQQNERRLKEQAKRWLTGIEIPLYEKAIKSIPRALFSLRVGFHGWVALGTHAPTVAFQPKFWNVYARDFVKMYRMVGNPLTGKGQARAAAYYERQVQDLQQRPNYAKARKAGLVNDPFQYEEYHVRGIANPLPTISPKVADWANKFTGMGNRGYAVLKILRQDMFDQMWNGLPDTIQKSDALAAAIADGVNHSTGVVKGSAHPAFGLALFAPRLEASRAMWIGGDPGRAALTFLRWNRATPEEKFFAKNQVYEKAWVAGTLGSMLALNAGFNAAVGSDQTINVIDPFKSDFLKFKVAGMNVSYGSAMVTMARLPVELAYYAVRPGGKLKNLVYPDEDFSYAIWKFARSQFSPFASLTSDLLFQSDYQGRLLPWSNRPMPKRLRAQGVEPYTWPEFWVEQASPIPFQEAEREIWPAVREIWQGMGMSEEQMRRLGKAWTIWTFMTFTGGRMREDTQSQQPQSYIGPTP